jgi:hypothetical protein
MIPLEKQVCNLALAKRLKELGVKQESLFYWVKEVATKGENYHAVYLYGVSDTKRRFINIQCSAFTVAELGEMLLQINWQHYEPYLNKEGWQWFFQVKWGRSNAWHKKYHGEPANTEADARAKMLIYLVEQNRVTL